MDSSNAIVTSPDMLEESPHNVVQEDALSSKEIIDQSQSNEGVNNHESSLSKSVRASPPPRLSGSPENPPLPSPVDEEEEREYGCRYCEKVFSSKQALGGHMNAHKLERTIEKKILDRQMAPNCAYPSHFSGSLFNRSQKFFNRAMMNMPYFAQQCTTHRGMMRYGRAPPPLPGINEGYPGRPMPLPGNVTQFMARPGFSCLENRPPGIHSPMSVPNWNFLGEISNLQMNGRETRGVQDDSGLDLTLRL
ncbi:unnamed protein product [Fraxinus pennsylvanica]|uniref:C2H2-type domain-containing protein n=1 Tax=Fraxinus pennsylvanica TaxID=56036 RepID=A0AAD2A780_9LAMI|nr:unnamed protein product [Fraxinus pennsylvanica]